MKRFSIATAVVAMAGAALMMGAGTASADRGIAQVPTKAECLELERHWELLTTGDFYCRVSGLAPNQNWVLRLRT